MEKDKVLESYNKNHNKGTTILITVILMGYAFFFLSPILFHEQPVKQFTSLNVPVSFSSGRITIESWQYSQEQSMFEVCCSFSNVSIVGVNTEANCNFNYKSKGTKSLECKQMYSNSNYIVVEIYGVPEDWYCASLKFITGYEETTITVETNEDDIQVLNGGDNSETTTDRSSVFTCIEEVEQVEHIKENKNDSDYMVERAERKISYDKGIIEDNKVTINQYDADIKSFEDEIENIKDEMTFQVESEIKTSQSRINQLETKIKDIQNARQALSNDTDKLEDEILQYEDIIESVKQ